MRKVRTKKKITWLIAEEDSLVYISAFNTVQDML